MFNFVRLSDGGEATPAGELKSEVEITCQIAERLLPEGPFPWGEMKSHDAIRQCDGEGRPRLRRHRHDRDDEARSSRSPAARSTSRASTPRPGRARASVPATTSFDVADGEFRMMTLRSEGQFNTVVYEEEDLYRGNTRRDVVMMNAADGAKMGITEGHPLTVSNDTGSLQVSAAFIDIPEGNVAMYYPEANVLVPQRIDRCVRHPRVQVDRGTHLALSAIDPSRSPAPCPAST